MFTQLNACSRLKAPEVQLIISAYAAGGVAPQLPVDAPLTEVYLPCVRDL
jgi:hypothetical protein